jgi:phage terminase large subunit
MGLDDPEKIKSITGLTDAWLEEATVFTLDDFSQVNLRVRDPQALD